MWSQHEVYVRIVGKSVCVWMRLFILMYVRMYSVTLLNIRTYCQLVHRPNSLLSHIFYLARVHQYGEGIRVLCQLPNLPSPMLFTYIRSCIGTFSTC